MTHSQPNKGNNPASSLDFARLTGRGVKIAIVDSGIDAHHPRIGGVAGGVGLSRGADGEIITGHDTGDLAGHGTACAGLIHRKAPDARLYSIRIFDESLSADGRLLVAAIRWAVRHGMDVVNLSLGTTDAAYRSTIAVACRRAVRAGIVLVAAGHLEGDESYPAALPDVIGVTGGAIYERYGYHYRPGQPIECVARGDDQRVCWSDGREIMAAGTSFAAPHISAVVALIREAQPKATLAELRRSLEANALQAPSPIGSPIEPRKAATPRITPIEPAEASDYAWIRKATLYPFNKEMHAFIRFRDLLDFEIVGIADPIGKGLVGKDAGEAIGAESAGIRIACRIEDAIEGSDTLILGYVDELTRMSRRDLLRESIEIALANHLNAFSFLPVLPDVYGDLYDAARRKGLRIAYPDIPIDEVARTLMAGAGSNIDVPVLGVFGTSASQGKFTLQLALRRALLKEGYRVGQIGTEHHARLFGLDLAFPMGYASPLSFPVEYYVPYLNSRARDICRRRHPHILLVGSQSGTIPYDVNESRTHALPSIAFLLGTRPDACILAVNSIDPEAYIRDTMDGIRSVAKAPTILLAMSDKAKHIRAAYGRSFVTPRQMSREEIDRERSRIEQTFGVPTIVIVSDEDQRRMVETVIAHFSAAGPSPN